MTLNDECARRLDEFRNKLDALGLDGALLVSATDVFYFCGTRQNGTLWVPLSAEPLLLVRKSVERAAAECVGATVRPFPPTKELAGIIGRVRRAGFTFDVAPAALLQYWSRALPGVEFVNVTPALLEQRSVKSPWELDRMRATARMLCDVFRAVPGFLSEGMRELDLAAEIEVRLKRAGNEGSPRVRGFNQEFFMGIALAGASATKPSYFDGPLTGRGLSASSPIGSSTDAILRNSPILIDYTAMKDGYGTDMTRMAVLGDLPAAAESAFRVALEIQQEVVRDLRPGSVPVDLWNRACAIADRAGLSAQFMGPPGAQVRFIGHGVGLELDEWPVLAPGFETPLIAGQVLAVEPKFVLPGVGAVGIENSWVVTPAGGERLTDLPDEIMRL